MTDCEKFIEMCQAELENFIKETDSNILKLKQEILKNYNLAQPYLSNLKSLKTELKKNLEKIETAKNFLSIEKNGSLVSNIDLEEIKNSVNETLEKTKTSKKTKFNSPLVTNWINKKN